MPNVVVFVSDFELGTRIADAVSRQGYQVSFPGDNARGVEEISQDTSLTIIDLDDETYGPMDLIRRIRERYPDLPIVGFLSRVRKRLHHQARDAGCTWVLPRSSLVQNLPTLIEKRSPGT